VVLGLLVALAVRAPVWVSGLIVGVFAVFHGHAHGTELPEAYGPYGYAAGFVVATALLHAAGMALGLFTQSSVGKTAVRGTGGAIALVGSAFLFGVA
jgi:urease accessory protein